MQYIMMVLPHILYTLVDLISLLNSNSHGTYIRQSLLYFSISYKNDTNLIEIPSLLL